MRQIKFRGKRIDNNEWVYGSLTQSEAHNKNGEPFMVSYIAPSIPVASEGGFELVKMDRVKPATVGQFTGLHDKNGKEVYEGDIVRLRVSDNRYKRNPRYTTKTIRYDNRLARFEADGIYWINLSSDRIEVIGNVFDSPKLIEKGGK